MYHISYVSQTYVSTVYLKNFRGERALFQTNISQGQAISEFHFHCNIFVIYF